MKTLVSLLFKSILLCLAASAAGLLYNCFYPKGIDLHVLWKDPKSVPPPEIAEKIGEVDTAATRAHFDAGTARFIDARTREDYITGHIPDAYLFNIHKYDIYSPILLPLLPPDDTYIIYCSGGDCEASHDLAGRLAQMGYSHLFVYQDGFPAWQEGGHPVDVLPPPHPLPEE